MQILRFKCHLDLRNGLSQLLSAKGQSTVEFAVVFAGFLSMVLAMGVLWNFLGDANVVSHAMRSASHTVTGVYSQAVCDVFLY